MDELIRQLTTKKIDISDINRYYSNLLHILAAIMNIIVLIPTFLFIYIIYSNINFLIPLIMTISIFLFILNKAIFSLLKQYNFLKDYKEEFKNKSDKEIAKIILNNISPEYFIIMYKDLKKYFKKNGLLIVFYSTENNNFFTNKSFIEHKNFIKYLKNLSLSKDIHILELFFSIEKKLEKNMSPTNFKSFKYDIINDNLKTLIKSKDKNKAKILKKVYQYLKDNDIKNKYTHILYEEFNNKKDNINNKESINTLLSDIDMVKAF